MSTLRMPEGTVVRVVSNLGIEVQDRGGELWARCPGHRERTGNDDHNPSWSINIETGLFHCFSCHWSGNILTLIRELGGDEKLGTFKAEIEILGRVGNFRKGDVKSKVRSLRTRHHRSHTEGIPKTHLAIYSADIPHRTLKERHLKQESASEYSVLWDHPTHSWVLPFFHPDNYLVGYQMKSSTSRRFRNVPSGMDKSSTLFGIQVVYDSTSVIVVESPLDAVRLHGCGYPSVALGGSKASDEQLKILSNFDRVIFSLDNDSAGSAEHARLRRVSRVYGIRAIHIQPDDRFKDPGDMGDDDIHSLFGGHLVQH